MKALETIIASNITELRKSQKWTQAELAEKINYSDKSVSKWERGDSIPDVKILLEMAKLFGVTVDYFLHENASAEKSKYVVNKSTLGYRIATTLLSIVMIWLAATVFFVYSYLSGGGNISYSWLIFVCAVPLSFLILLIEDRRWFGRRLDITCTSSITWSSITVFFLYCLLVKGINVWLVYLIGVPLQACIILLYLARKSK